MDIDINGFVRFFGGDGVEGCRIHTYRKRGRGCVYHTQTDRQTNILELARIYIYILYRGGKRTAVARLLRL